jgi:inhibitor of cysteine peptidase
MREVTIDADAADQTHQAEVGDVVVIRLPETPMSGFRWQVDGADSDALESQGDEFVEATDAQTGGGGVREFRFAVRNPHPAGVRLSLRRAWEADQPPAESFATTINGA